MLSKNIRQTISVQDKGTFSVQQDAHTGSVHVSDIKYTPGENEPTVKGSVHTDAGQYIEYSWAKGEKEPRATGGIPPGPIAGSGVPTT